ncbi:MAG: sugar phosphate isomerase/epimerase family protein [Acutalibacteraceae bacterium]
MIIGAQFYTLRNFCKTLDDFSETLNKVADIGYTSVQISGTCAYEPEWLRDQLKANGLKCAVTHIPGDKLKADPVKVAHDHDIFDCEYVGLGCYNFAAEDATTEKFTEEYLPVAKAIHSAGKYFMYHNHDAEFKWENGKTILANLAEKISPELMGFTLDTFWVQAGGGDPAAWIEYLSGRVPCIHLKDYSYGRKMAVIGEGNINFDRVFKSAEKAGTKYMLVEQDECYGEDPFDCLARSYKYLSSLGFK